MAKKVMDSSTYKTWGGTSFDQGKGHKSKNITKQTIQPHCVKYNLKRLWFGYFKHKINNISSHIPTFRTNFS